MINRIPLIGLQSLRLGLPQQDRSSSFSTIQIKADFEAEVGKRVQQNDRQTNGSAMFSIARFEDEQPWEAPYEHH